MAAKKKVCPHCGAAFRDNPPQGIGPYGSPQRTCPDCKETYYDREYREIAVSGVSRMDRWAVTPNTIRLCGIPFLLGVLLLVYMIGSARFDVFQSLFVLMFIGFPAMIFTREAKGRPARLAYLEEETKASQRRLSDPAYARMLKEMGYKVPEACLAGDEKANP